MATFLSVAAIDGRPERAASSILAGNVQPGQIVEWHALLANAGGNVIVPVAIAFDPRQQDVVAATGAWTFIGQTVTWPSLSVPHGWLMYSVTTRIRSGAQCGSIIALALRAPHATPATAQLRVSCAPPHTQTHLVGTTATLAVAALQPTLPQIIAGVVPRQGGSRSDSLFIVQAPSGTVSQITQLGVQALTLSRSSGYRMATANGTYIGIGYGNPLVLTVERGGHALTQLNQPISLTLSYDPVLLPKPDPRLLHLALYDPIDQLWIALPTSVNRTTHTVTTELLHEGIVQVRLLIPVPLLALQAHLVTTPHARSRTAHRIQVVIAAQSSLADAQIIVRVVQGDGWVATQTKQHADSHGQVVWSVSLQATASTHPLPHRVRISAVLQFYSATVQQTLTLQVPTH